MVSPSTLSPSHFITPTRPLPRTANLRYKNASPNLDLLFYHHPSKTGVECFCIRCIDDEEFLLHRRQALLTEEDPVKDCIDLDDLNQGTS